MLSLSRSINAGMTLFCNVGLAKRVSGKENLSLFACFFTL